MNKNPAAAPSSIYIEKKAVKQNIAFVKKQLNSTTLLSAVVKGNAYGHGIKEMIPLFEKNGIDHFSVFSAHEAYEVHKVKSKNAHIMIMGWLDDDEIDWAIEHDISFFVFEIDRLNKAIDAAKKINKTALVHLELETGMNRTGLESDYLEEAISLFLENKNCLKLEGLCTHYAGAESITNHFRIKDQIELFHRYVNQIEAAGLKAKYKHTACSAAVISYPETQMDLVRVGILLYGFWPSKETFIFHQRNTRKENERAKDPLKRVINWTSKVMSTKKVPMGDFIGYGTSYQTSRDMEVATVPVGYAYGFARSLSNQGRVIVKGKRVTVIGTINMNLLIIDITEVKQVLKGDKVILIGKQGKAEVTVSSFGELSNQLNYELLSRLPMDIPRVIK